MKAFLLAAGLGTRLGPLTDETPKCLLPVGGRPLLGRWLEHLGRFGVGTVLVNTHHLADRVRDYLASGMHPQEIVVTHEGELLGSAGTLRANRDFVKGDEGFLVVYADNASTVDLAALVDGHTADMAATLGLYRVADPRSCGVVELDEQGTVASFVEKPEHPRSDLAWAGLAFGTGALIDAIPDRFPCDLGSEVLPSLAGRMRGVEIDGYHRDIGTPESYRITCRDFESMERPA